MSIKSFLVKQEGQIQTLLLDVVTSRGHYFCSLGIGEMVQGKYVGSQVGELALERLDAYSAQCNGAVHLIPINSLKEAERGVPHAFLIAMPSDAVFFVCKDSRVYDSVYSLLRLQPHDAFTAGSHKQ